MKPHPLSHVLRGVLVAALATSAPPAASAQELSTSGTTIHYEPREKTGEKGRVDGNNRGGAKLPNLFILSPDHVGLTVQEQPSIFCFVSDSTDIPDVQLTATLTRDDLDQPLVERKLGKPARGIVRLDLAPEKVKLDVDVKYRLSFSLIPDRQRGSQSVVTSGMIKRIKPPAPLLAKLSARADPMDRAFACAREGIWYDALTIICDAVAQAKNAASERAIREQRAVLLDQVALAEAAKFDRSVK